MISPKRSKLSDMSQNIATMDTSIGLLKLLKCLNRSTEISLPLEQASSPPKFSVKAEYPDKKWSADASHIKYRLDKNKDLDTIQKEVLLRMFHFNQAYLQAILDGEVECILRKSYLATDPPHQMPIVSGSHMFGQRNTDILVELMMKELQLREDSVSGRCNLCLSVLMPELVAKMMSDMYNCTREEASQKMANFAHQLANSVAL